MNIKMLKNLFNDVVREIDLLHLATIEEGYSLLDIKPITYRKHLEDVFKGYEVVLTDKFLDDCLTYYWAEQIVYTLF